MYISLLGIYNKIMGLSCQKKKKNTPTTKLTPISGSSKSIIEYLFTEAKSVIDINNIISKVLSFKWCPVKSEE